MIEDKLIGVDIGGTKISAGLITRNSIIKKVTIDTEPKKSKADIIQNVYSAIDNVWHPEVKGIGIGVPGLVDPKEGVIYQLQNIPSWQEVKLKELIQAKYNVQAFINNDANCFALGEKYFGKGKSFKNFVGITLGTGIGAGIIIGNKLYSGNFSGAGEFGSIPYKNSSFEKYCSSQFFENEYDTTGYKVFLKAINGDEEALEIWNRFGENLGHFIHVILFALAPEAVIIGGSISASFGLFERSMNETINKFPFGRIKDGFCVKCSKSPDVAILGAGALYLNSNSQAKSKSVLSNI